MGTKVIRELFDDLDNDIAADETVTFAIDGQAYEMDLSKKNAEKLRAHLGPFVASARRVGRVTTAKPKSSPSTSGGGKSSVDLDAVRTWARTRGHTVSDRGRIPNDIMDAWEAAQQSVADKPAAGKAPSAKAAAAKASDVKEPAFSGT